MKLENAKVSVTLEDPNKLIEEVDIGGYIIKDSEGNIYT